MGTKNTPGQFDCFANADPDLWILLNYPHDCILPSRVFGEDMRRRALEQLREVSRIPVPARLYLEREAKS